MVEEWFQLVGSHGGRSLIYPACNPSFVVWKGWGFVGLEQPGLGSAGERSFFSKEKIRDRITVDNCSFTLDPN